MAKVTPNDAGVEMVYEALFDHESGMGGMMGDGVTTVTFYKGDMAAGTAYLKDRLPGDCFVAAANPWWGGASSNPALKALGFKFLS